MARFKVIVCFFSLYSYFMLFNIHLLGYIYETEEQTRRRRSNSWGTKSFVIMRLPEFLASALCLNSSKPNNSALYRTTRLSLKSGCLNSSKPNNSALYRTTRLSLKSGSCLAIHHIVCVQNGNLWALRAQVKSNAL